MVLCHQLHTVYNALNPLDATALPAYLFINLAITSVCCRHTLQHRSKLIGTNRWPYDSAPLQVVEKMIRDTGGTGAF